MVSGSLWVQLWLYSQMTIDCDVPPNLQLQEEVLVENLLSALITKALKDEGVECRGVVCERLDDVNPLE
jgi:hypothetical protein